MLVDLILIEDFKQDIFYKLPHCQTCLSPFCRVILKWLQKKRSLVSQLPCYLWPLSQVRMFLVRVCKEGKPR